MRSMVSRQVYFGNRRTEFRTFARARSSREDASSLDSFIASIGNACANTAPATMSATTRARRDTLPLPALYVDTRQLAGSILHADFPPSSPPVTPNLIRYTGFFVQKQSYSRRYSFPKRVPSFSVEPLIAKKILPWFGGSAAVWSVCLVFFQGVLLFGYIYARVLARLPAARQALIHTLLLLLSCTALPLGPRASWRPALGADPAWPLLALLCVSVGLPFFALSATSPLLQTWASRAGSRNPYRLFALSNAASLAALIGYPFLIERHRSKYSKRLLVVWLWIVRFVLAPRLPGTVAGACARFRSPTELSANGRPGVSYSLGLRWQVVDPCSCFRSPITFLKT